MLTTSHRLKWYRTEHGSQCVYSAVTGEIYAYHPYTTDLLGTVVLAPTDVATFEATGLSANVPYSIGTFLLALAPIEPTDVSATAENVPAEVWEEVLKPRPATW